VHFGRLKLAFLVLVVSYIMQHYAVWGIIFAEGITSYMLCQFRANSESGPKDNVGLISPQTIAPCLETLAVILKK